MKKFLSIFFISSISFLTFAQGPGSASNPMTAPGAIGIDDSQHILYWQNPSDVQYNECYFSSDSSLVTNLDTTVRIKNGFPSTVFNSAPVNPLTQNTRYFWCVVEYNASGNSVSQVWDFYSQPPAAFLYEYHFENDFEGWQIAGPSGYNNWHWLNSSHTGSFPGEIAFFWDPVFIGDSYIMSPEIPCPAGANILIDFSYYEDWWSDTVVVGSAITLDDGNSWSSIWELVATGNVGPSSFSTIILPEGNFRLGFYYTGNSNNIDFLYTDDIFIATPLTVAYPPSLLEAEASLTEQKVTLNWDPGVPLGPPMGYRLQRKPGLPNDNSPYVTISETGFATLNFNDETVELNHIYTYRIAMISSGGNVSHYGNEATAYVPAIVPVELVSFTASVSGKNVNLIWMTSTETNNSGFEVQRLKNSKIEKLQDWEKIGFVPGFGTTTEVHNYSFTDESLQSGNYNYRLKQIDYDGTFSFSNEVIVEIVAPKEFSLEQNYPNPFNPSTSIQYSISSRQFVTLKVYDILGNEIATLVNEEKPAGGYEVEFNASSFNHHSSSGVYFYSLSAGNYFATKKMILLK